MNGLWMYGEQMISTQEQVKLLWSILPHPTPESVVRLFAKGGGKKFGDFARNPADIIRFIEGSPSMDIYIAPNPTLCTTGIRHTAADVTHWSYLLLDVDPIMEESQPLVVLEKVLRQLEDWTGQDLRPIILDSGRGAQAWIRLEDLLLSDVETSLDALWGPDSREPILRKTARKVMGHWLKRLAEKLGTFEGCRLDSCTSDLPRVMRCPGTINVKTGRVASLVVVTEEAHHGLAHLLVIGTPERVFDEPEPGELAPGTPWQLVFTKLTLKAQRYLTEGKEDPGRHETMWHVCKKLQEVGIDKNEARRALQYANNLLGPDLALPAEQIETDLNQVYGRA
jgi:hypothetical protein